MSKQLIGQLLEGLTGDDNRMEMGMMETGVKGSRGEGRKTLSSKPIYAVRSGSIRAHDHSHFKRH